MKIIRKVRVQRFRSIRDDALDGLGEFSVLAGLNNAGKSNYLRALNAFFTGRIDTDSDINVTRDYYRSDLKKKNRKTIRVSVEFDLPDNFKFRSEFKPTADLLTDNFIITKEWNVKEREPKIFLNEDSVALNPDDQAKVLGFLSLINFRYVPNRVLPIDVIKREHESLRDVLIRRLAKYKTSAQNLFKGISKVSESIIVDVSDSISKINPDISSINLATASSLADLAFRFGYELQEGQINTDESEQGSGMQSLLMFQTLNLIDRDYYQQFGWRQASIWAVEEPESSLHTKLEAEIASFLSRISIDEASRLQIIATTHSDIMIQYADNGYSVEKKTAPPSVHPSSVAEKQEKRNLLEYAARVGVSRWVNPILRYPLDALVLVEGRTDKEFFLEVLRILKVRPKYRVECLEDLTDDPDQGGVETLLKYIKNNTAPLKTRSDASPVLMLLDWDAADKVAVFEKIINNKKIFKAIAWPEEESNPKLEPSFRGIEKFYSDRMIKAVRAKRPDLIGELGDGKWDVNAKKYDAVKKELATLVKKGLQDDDIKYAKKFVSKVNELLAITL